MSTNKSLPSVIVATTIGTPGGTWRHLRELLAGLEERGLDVTLALEARSTDFHQVVHEAGLRWMDLRASLRAEADIWHLQIHDTMQRRDVPMIATRSLFGPVVVTEHLPRSNAADPTLAPYDRRHRGAATVKLIQKKLEYSRISQVIAVSSTSAAFIRDRYGLPAEKLSLVHNGIARPALAPSPPDTRGRPLRVLALGTFIWQKGFDLLFDAMALTRQEWTLELIGSGYCLPEFREKSERMGPSRVVLREWVDDPGAHFAAADVICMPSRWESFPYTALEAMVAARPLIGTRVDGLDEIIRDGVNGLLIDSESAEEVAGAIDRLAGDPALVAKMGAQAFEDVAQYSLDAMVDGVISAYQRVLR